MVTSESPAARSGEIINNMSGAKRSLLFTFIVFIYGAKITKKMMKYLVNCNT